MSKHKADADQTLDGISFEIDQLIALRRLALPGIQIEVQTPASRVEELVVFRIRSEPSIIAATLRRSSAGSFKIVGYNLSEEANAELLEAAFPNFDLALYALSKLFSAERV